MRTIEVNEPRFEAISRLAGERGVTTQEPLAAWLAEDAWAEHAARAYDNYVPGSGEIFLSDEEFLASLWNGPMDEVRSQPCDSM